MDLPTWENGAPLYRFGRHTEGFCVLTVLKHEKEEPAPVCWNQSDRLRRDHVAGPRFETASTFSIPRAGCRGSTKLATVRNKKFCIYKV